MRCLIFLPGGGEEDEERQAKETAHNRGFISRGESKIAGMLEATTAGVIGGSPSSALLAVAIAR